MLHSVPTRVHRCVAEAGDLKRQLRKAKEREARFDERVVWKYFSQIAEAVAHMHSKRIMHRDLKPANIFLTLNGTVKVGDLGLGRLMSENTMEAHSKVRVRPCVRDVCTRAQCARTVWYDVCARRWARPCTCLRRCCVARAMSSSPTFGH